MMHSTCHKERLPPSGTNYPDNLGEHFLIACVPFLSFAKIYNTSTWATSCCDGEFLMMLPVFFCLRPLCWTLRTLTNVMLSWTITWLTVKCYAQRKAQYPKILRSLMHWNKAQGQLVVHEYVEKKRVSHQDVRTRSHSRRRGFSRPSLRWRDKQSIIMKSDYSDALWYICQQDLLLRTAFVTNEPDYNVWSSFLAQYSSSAYPSLGVWRYSTQRGWREFYSVCHAWLRVAPEAFVKNSRVV